jgi:competence protein ComEC
MAGVIAPAPANPSLGERARRFLSAQVAAQTLRWRLWAPAAFGGGCAAYFALDTEPAAWPLVAAALLAAGLWLGGRRLALPRFVGLTLMLLACFALGAAVAKLRTDAVAAPIARPWPSPLWSRAGS